MIQRAIRSNYGSHLPCSVACDAVDGSPLLGHMVTLMPPPFVKPYASENKNDAADAGAVCDPVMRPTTRLVCKKARSIRIR